MAHSFDNLSIFLIKNFISFRLIDFKEAHIVAAQGGKSPPSDEEEENMSILTAIARYAAELGEARTRFHNERILGSLPLDVQKDIGWRIDHPRPQAINRSWLKR